MTTRRPLADRFWEKVHKTESCWLWTASVKDGFPYGQIGHPGTRTPRRAHRVSWELHNGPIPAGLFVLHKCDNPRCVRPDHLFLGTQSDNLKDAYSKGRMVSPMAGRTQCKNGHAYRDGSYWRNKTTRARVCRQCMKDAKGRLLARNPNYDTEYQANYYQMKKKGMR